MSIRGYDQQLTDNNNNSFPFYHSLTAYAVHEVAKFRENGGEGLDKVFRIVTSEAAFLGLTLFGAIETVVRSILSLVAKGIHFCIPKDSSEWFEKNIYAPSVSGAIASALTMGYSATMLAANFMDEEDRFDTLEKVAKTWEEAFGVFEGFIEAHIC